MVEDVDRAVQHPAREGAHRGRVPVVRNDAVPLTEQVGELGDVEQCSGDLPRCTHGRGEPFADGDVGVGGGAEVALDLGDLGRLAFALHEEHAVELERGGVVEVLGPFEGTERDGVRGRDGRPAVGEGLERPRVPLQRDGQLPRRRPVELLVLAVEGGEVGDGTEERGLLIGFAAGHGAPCFAGLVVGLTVGLCHTADQRTERGG